MSIDGTYNLEINSPMGTRTAALMMKSEGNSLSGTFTDEQGETLLKDGSITGEGFSFTVEITTPMGPIGLNFSGAVSGDSISGQVQSGQMGSFPFTGAKV
ncbi:MAG: hypothetical protein JW762_03290 [Dehalococcoidales bacterium]|nr:hypothetical protein [Dehalococcoidales bacterium]